MFYICFSKCYTCFLSAGPLGHRACGGSLSSILHSSLFPIVVLSSPYTLFPLPYCGPSKLCILRFLSSIVPLSSFLWPRKVEYRREGWGSRSAISDGGGLDCLPLATQAPWPAALLALLAVQDRSGSSQETPGANQEPPRATQDRLKIPLIRPKIAQERPKSPQERPKTTPRATQEPPRATPGRPGSQKLWFSLMFFNVFRKLDFCNQDRWKIDLGAPRSRQERSRAPQERPRPPQERPRPPQDRP